MKTKTFRQAHLNKMINSLHRHRQTDKHSETGRQTDKERQKCTHAHTHARVRTVHTHKNTHTHETERERERERARERARERERETETERQRETEIETETERERDRKEERELQKQKTKNKTKKTFKKKTTDNFTTQQFIKTPQGVSPIFSRTHRTLHLARFYSAAPKAESQSTELSHIFAYLQFTAQLATPLILQCHDAQAHKTAAEKKASTVS